MCVVCSVLVFCAHVTAALPFKRGDEPCAVIHCINALIASKAEGILKALQPLLLPANGELANGDLANGDSHSALEVSYVSGFRFEVSYGSSSSGQGQVCGMQALQHKMCCLLDDV